MWDDFFAAVLILFEEAWKHKLRATVVLLLLGAWVLFLTTGCDNETFYVQQNPLGNSILWTRCLDNGAPIKICVEPRECGDYCDVRRKELVKPCEAKPQ